MIPDLSLLPDPITLWSTLSDSLATLAATVRQLLDLSQDVLGTVRQAGRDPIILCSVLVLYTFLIALPFAPGAEIGFLLLLLYGASMAVPVYLATVLALTLAFMAGRLLPDRIIERIMARIGRRSAGRRGDGAQRDGEPVSSFARWGRKLSKHRVAVLVVLLNMPGNSILGGGGGIALAAGAGRLIKPRTFVLSAALAVAPIPLAVLILGRADFLEFLIA